MDGCCCTLLKFVRSLSLCFEPAPFRASRDKAHLKLVCDALSSEEWMRQLKAIGWYCKHMGTILAWGGSCRCHDEFSDREEREKCPWKGRLLAEAFGYATRALDEMRAEVDGLQPEFLDGDLGLLRQLQACVRANLGFGERETSDFRRAAAAPGSPSPARHCEQGHCAMARGSSVQPPPRERRVLGPSVVLAVCCGADDSRWWKHARRPVGGMAQPEGGASRRHPR